MRRKRLLRRAYIRWRALALAALICAALVALASLGGCARDGKGERPRISSSTDSGAPGDEIKITGEGFGEGQGTSAVSIGGAEAQVVSWSGTVITARVPDDLPAGDYSLVVKTDNGDSNEMPFTVKAAEKPGGRKEGEIEHITPVQAMLDRIQKMGMNPEGMTFSVVQVSEKDPSWKIDKATRTGADAIFFLLHEENGDWVVKDDGRELTKAELTAEGAPGDLYGQPHPETQAQAVWDYIRKNGGDPTGFSVVITRDSTIDGNWEIGIARKAGRPDQTVVLHRESGSWVCKGMDTEMSYAEMISLGVPKDIAHSDREALAIEKWIESGQADPGVEPTGWALSVYKVSRIDPDWEIVKGQQAQAGTMYFALHWEGMDWSVKDAAGDFKAGEVPGMPGDLTAP